MRILGIDPGLGTLGWGVIDTDGVKHRVVQYGAILTTPGEALPQRLRAIFKSVTQLMDARRNRWSRTLLNAIGVPGRLLPEIVPPESLNVPSLYTPPPSPLLKALSLPTALLSEILPP